MTDLTTDHPLLEMLSQLPTPMMVCDTATGKVLWVHVPDLSLIGTNDPSHVVGRNLLDFLTPDQHAIALRDIARVAAGEEYVAPVIYRLNRLDGGRSAVHASSTQISFNGIPAMLTLMFDMSDREQTLQELQDSEERYRCLIESLPDGIVIIVGTEVGFVNKAASELFGASEPEELVGRSIYDLVDSDSREILKKRQRQIYKTGGALPEVSVRMIGLDGTSFKACLHSTLVTWHGEPAVQTHLRVDDPPVR